MRNIKEFKNREVAVKFENNKEFKEFMELCNKNNVPKLTTFSCNNILTTSKYPVGNGHITFWTDLKEFNDDDSPNKPKLVPASEFLTQSTPTIEIFQSKQMVVCLKKQGNKVVAVGKAKCNPDDVFDFDYGAKLAYERMEMDIVHRTIKMAGESLAQGLSDGMKGIKTLKNGMRIKKQDSYEVGDRVLIKKKWKSPIAVNQMDFMLGNVYEIMKCEGKYDDEKYGNCYKLKARSNGEHWEDYWIVCRSDIKGKVIQ